MPIRMAKVEVSFLQDHRMVAMNPSERLAYLALWLLAIETRREVLPKSAVAPSYISHRASVLPRHAQSMITKASGCTPPLLTIDSRGNVTVCGVKKLNARLFSPSISSNTNTLKHKPPAPTKGGEVIGADADPVIQAWEEATNKKCSISARARLQAIRIHTDEAATLYGIEQAVLYEALNLKYVETVAKSNHSGAKSPKEESLEDQAKRLYG